MIRIGAVAFLLALVAVGCGENEECKQLKAILKKRTEVLASAHAQADVLERVQQREIEMEARAKKAKADLGLEQSEPDIFRILSARVKTIPTATITRSTRMESVDESNPHAPEVSATLWIVRFQEKDPAKAFERIDEIIKPPPLVRLAAIIKRDRNKADWRLEILRAVVDEVPINPKPVVLPKSEDLSKVPSGIGSCGAGRLRKQIEDTDAEIEALRKHAEKTTQLLPASASWEGVGSRTKLLRDTEFKYRDLVDALEHAALSARLPVKGIAVEGGLAVLEVWGGPKDRPKLEKALVEEKLGESMRFIENPPPGVVRVGLPNTILEGRRQKREGAPR